MIDQKISANLENVTTQIEIIEITKDFSVFFFKFNLLYSHLH